MTKHMTLRLAPDHPIFKYPKRDRRKKLREWMESGMNIEGHIRDINDITGPPPPDASLVVKQYSPAIIMNEEEAIAKNDRMLKNALADFLDL